jgi:hypothetical protein
MHAAKIHPIKKISCSIAIYLCLLNHSHAYPTAAEIARALLENDRFIEKTCSINAKMFISIKEQLATSLRVNPESMSLKRLEVKIDYHGDRQLKGCVGHFYHINGVTACDLEFDQSGVISKACNFGYENTYSGKLKKAATATTESEQEAWNKMEGFSKGYEKDEHGMIKRK